MLRHNCTIYCPPKCPFSPEYCLPECEDAINCEEILLSNCVIYEGTNLEQYGIEPGSNLTDVIIALANLVYNDCIPTTTTTQLPVTTTTTTTFVEPISCITYSDYSGSGHEYNISNSQTPIYLPGDEFNNFAETHTDYKYFKGKQDGLLIREWVKQNNTGTLTHTRDIILPSGVFDYNYFTALQAVDDNTILTTASIGGANYLFKLDITNDVLVSGDITLLFPIIGSETSYGIEEILLTIDNKLIGIIRKNMLGYPPYGVPHIVQYDYLTGALELDISLEYLIIAEPSVTFYLFQNNDGNLYFSTQFPYPLSKIYQIDLNPPYTTSLVIPDAIFIGSVPNSKLNCNTVSLQTN